MGAVELPDFDELPLLAGQPLRHAWDVFGRDDNLGTLNLITDETVRRGLAAALIGERVSLTMALSQPDPPLFGRLAMHQSLVQLDRNTWDDRLDSVFPQSSSQWDGFRHVRCREHGFWTGVVEEPRDIPAERLGIEHFAKGVIGRGVLLDVAGFCAAAGESYDPLNSHAITADVLRRTADAHGLDIVPGDILCVRVGWQQAYAALPEPDRAAMGIPDAHLRYAGLAGSEATARQLWDWHVAAITCDNPSIEVSPGDPADGSLHRRILPTLGLVMGELFDFEQLAARCAELDRWTFAFVGVPWNMPGGLGSPANAVAIL